MVQIDREIAYPNNPPAYPNAKEKAKEIYNQLEVYQKSSYDLCFYKFVIEVAEELKEEGDTWLQCTEDKIESFREV